MAAQIFAGRMPTLVLGDEGGFRDSFHAQIGEYLADAPRIARNTPSAWESPAFRAALEKSAGRA